MAEVGEYSKLPPGWDCKYDQSTGKCYYINYMTRAMQLEDPRLRYKQLQNEKCSTESIPLQPLHGSPYHVYPATNLYAVKAFQSPKSQSVSGSPLLPKNQVEMSPISQPHSTLQTPPMTNVPRRQTIQETSFANHSDMDAVVTKINNMFPTASENHIRLLLKKYYNREAVVISALQVEKHPVTMPGPFATPPSQRHLYHSNSNSQMVLHSKRFDSIFGDENPIPISATSGLYRSSPFRDQIKSTPKPHSSPKMKLRYLKSIFPKAEETLLLDILINADNNVQKASETLISMGYSKREVTCAPKISDRITNAKLQKNEAESTEGEIIPLHPKFLTAEEKTKVKELLRERYKTIDESIILMALESVNYSEDRASQILQIVLQENGLKHAKENVTEKSSVEINIKEEPQMKEQCGSLNEAKKSKYKSVNITANTSSSSSTSRATTVSPSPSSSLKPSLSKTSQLGQTDAKQSVSLNVNNANDELIKSKNDENSREMSPTNNYRTFYLRDKRNSMKNSHKESIEEQQYSVNQQEFKSIIDRIPAKGHNPELSKGPDDSLLLADYVTWNGANPDISSSRKHLAVGPNSKLLSERNYTPLGHNSNLCKGPQNGMSKGSMYSQINQNIATDVKCN